MAPTVCLPELSVVRSTRNVYSRRRQRVSCIVNENQRRLELRRLPDVIDNTIVSSSVKSSSYKNDHSREPIDVKTKKVPGNLEERYDIVLPRREGLLNIVMRTLALVRRNRILQERVNALRAETRDFIRSVLNNPQNKCRQQDTTANRSKDAIVSSSTERIVLKSTLSRAPDLSSSPDIVTSTCCSPWENDD